MSAKIAIDSSSVLAMTSFSKWRIGIYLRISQEDKRADESASITNQRSLLRDYIKQREEFSESEIIEYVDDGLSGATTNRKDYNKMMRDVESGIINCIIVKDLSRIGRNMLETDELLMVYLVEWNTRFISLGDNYDSFVQPLSILELAIISLFNQDHIRELAQKSLSNRLAKIKQGEHVSGYAAFGYAKSKTNKNKLIIDNEAAEIIRFIFSLAIEGKVTREIAEILNAQEIITPSAYKSKRGQGTWHTIDPNYHFWNDSMVWAILANERYTGKLISKSYTEQGQGMFKTKHRAKEDWIIVPGAHPVIITEDEYRQARDMRQRNRNGTLADNIFISKVRCAICGHAMQRSKKYAPIFKCGTKRFTSHYNCAEQVVLQADIELIVLKSLKVYIDATVEFEELKLAALQQSKETKTSIERRIKAEQQAIKLLEKSITKIFTSMASGDMATEAFLSKKESINDSIAKKKETLETLESRLTALTTGRTTSEETVAKLCTFRNLEKLDRGVVDYLINRILVHGENDIEIVWNDCAG